MKWVADRTESFLTDAHGRDHHSTVEMAFDADNRIIGLKVDTIANFGAYMSLFSSSVPTYLYATLLSGQYAIPAIHANVRAVYTNTAPVDAYRGAGRPEATYLVERTVETAARELGVSPAELRRKNFVTTFPHQTPVIMCYDAGDYEASLTQRHEGLRLCRLCRPQGRRSRARQAARHRHELLHRGLRHRALGRGRLARRRRRPVGIGRGAGQRRRHDRGADRLAQPRPGP